MRHQRFCAIAFALTIILLVFSSVFAAFGQEEWTRDKITAEFSKASTGNIADAVDEATGQRGFMYRDMKPVFRTKIIGPAATAVLSRTLKYDNRERPNYQLEILDEAEPGSILVYVLEDGLETAGIGNLMATAGKVRGLAGAVIDGGARDTEEIEAIGFPVFSRSITPATSVGRYFSVAKQVPVTCAGVLVRPGDYIVGDRDGVVVVPKEKIGEVIRLIRQYDEKESKMVPIIKEQKSMLKAIAIYNRY
ncbi:MAG: RraA family protein [Acidobacteria bacterium]|nr:RraA family protein [Acidobacteriota bacterium]